MLCLDYNMSFQWLRCTRETFGFAVELPVTPAVGPRCERRYAFAKPLQADFDCKLFKFTRKGGNRGA
jgi:hypothetical protein